MPVPKVKTGPTAGQERSRNKDGAWRRKRSDTGILREVNNPSSLKLISMNGMRLIISSIVNFVIWVFNFIKNKKDKSES